MNRVIFYFFLIQPSFAFGQGLTIEGARFLGEGCQQLTTLIDVSPDQKAFTVRFSEYFAEVRSDGGSERARMQCNINLDVLTSPGWTFTIGQLDIRGYANVEQGAVVKQKVAYAFDGMLLDSDGFTVKGPFNSNFMVSTDLNMTTKNKWSKCGNNRHQLSIRTSLIAKANKGAGGYIAADSLDGEFKEKFQLIWQRCQSPSPNKPSPGDPSRGDRGDRKDHNDREHEKKHKDD